MSSFRVLAAGTALAIWATACGSDGADRSDAELLPFAAVQDSEFVFEADPFTPDRGIFRVTTTEPMICTIVWGETEAFGNFNNSLEMNGTGIVDHNVFLPGAQPGVEYRFRVQGSTADGRQFRSDTGTFVIDEVDPSAAAPSAGDTGHGDNIALGSTVLDASSEFSASWSAANAVDGDTATEWASLGDGDDGYLVIDLGTPREIGGVEFITRSMADGTAITEQFTVTVDGGETQGPFPAGSLAEPRFAPLSATGRQVRFDVDASTGGNVGAVEVRVYAPAG